MPVEGTDAIATEGARMGAKTRSPAITLAGQDIAPLPKTGDAARRARADGRFGFSG